MKLCSFPSAELPVLKEGQTGQTMDVSFASAVQVSEQSLCSLRGLGAVEHII